VPFCCLHGRADACVLTAKACNTLKYRLSLGWEVGGMKDSNISFSSQT